MAELLKIEDGWGLVFEPLVDGPAGASFALLLHGFAESFHMGRPLLLAFAAHLWS